MDIHTKFNCGDRIYVVFEDGIIGPMLVGQVRAEYVAAQEGPDPESIFGNMGRQRESYSESYMCFETGIGSGHVYEHSNCFATLAEADTEQARRIAAERVAIAQAKKGTRPCHPTNPES
jgi:hypothetical protein